MHWEIFLIPLIAMGVWLLGTIFRNAEEERARMARRLPRDGGLPLPPGPPAARAGAAACHPPRGRGAAGRQAALAEIARRGHSPARDSGAAAVQAAAGSSTLTRSAERPAGGPVHGPAGRPGSRSPSPS